MITLKVNPYCHECKCFEPQKHITKDGYDCKLDRYAYHMEIRCSKEKHCLKRYMTQKQPGGI